MSDILSDSDVEGSFSVFFDFMGIGAVTSRNSYLHCTVAMCTMYASNPQCTALAGGGMWSSDAHTAGCCLPLVEDLERGRDWRCTGALPLALRPDTGLPCRAVLHRGVRCLRRSTRHRNRSSGELGPPRRTIQHRRPSRRKARKPRLSVPDSRAGCIGRSGPRWLWCKRGDGVIVIAFLQKGT